MYSSAHRIHRGSPATAASSLGRIRALLLIFLTSLPVVGTHATATTRPPNILFMLTDDQRWDAIGLGDSKHLKTPHMDRLGQEGVYFKNAFCTTSLCSPSRASILNGEHGMVDKRTAHEPSIRIVQVVRYPGLTPPTQPKVIEPQVLTVDLAPSLLELCDAPPLRNIHGKSWVRLVQRGDRAWRKSWLCYYNYEKQFPYTPNVRSVRTDSWKYSRSPHGDGGPDRHLAELYRIEFDPEERQNLVANPKYAGVVKEMQRELIRARKRVGLNPDHDPMPLDQGIKQELPDAKIR